MALPLTLHLLATIVWVGGMFFAYQVLRPVAAIQLEPPGRLALWSGVFARFFRWVWLAVALLPVTGYWMVFSVFGGFGAVGWHVHLMQGIGWIMVALFVWLYFIPYPALNAALAASDFPNAATRLNTIRRIVGTNLLLGLVVSAIASGGRFL